MEAQEFIQRAEEFRRKYETLYKWHLAACEGADVDPPWSADETYINVTVDHWNPETKKYDVDIEASRQAIGKVTKWVTKRSDAIVTKNWTDDDLRLEVLVRSLDESTTYTVVYKVAREAVCEKKVVGYEDVPEYTRPAYKKEIVEWECNDVSLLKIASA